MRKVFLDDLPKWEDCRYENKIHWKKCIGYKVKFIYDNIDGYVEIINYIYPNLYIKYQDKENYKISTTRFQTCQLGNLLEVKTSNFKLKIGVVLKDNKRDLTIIDATYAKMKQYKYKCNICGNTDIVSEYFLLKGGGCNVCSVSSKKVLTGYNDVATTHPYLVNFLLNKEDAYVLSFNSTKQVKVVCPFCNTIKDSTLEKLYRNGRVPCICNDSFSYPEKVIYALLNQLNVKFVTQYSPKWIKPRRYDFYIPLYNTIIESNGSQHYTEGFQINGASKKYLRTLDEEKENDILKEKLAKENGIENYIIIDCRNSEIEFISNNIINSKLAEMFNLNQIDWLQCHEFALSNIVKTVCELWNLNNNYSFIKSNLLLGTQTIRKYLKQGNKLGWCNYDSEELVRRTNSENGKKNGRKNGESRSKKILCVENGIIFKSSKELVELSYEIFGVKMSRCAICQACNEKPHNLYKGYHFKYI